MDPIEVAAGLVFRRGKLLITQRRSEAHLGGLWEFPGGKRVGTESYVSCLRRELWEELGIEVEIGERLEALTHTYPEKTVYLEFYRCMWRRHEPRNLGCSAHHWVTPQELTAYTFPPADALLLSRLRADPTLWAFSFHPMTG